MKKPNMVKAWSFSVRCPDGTNFIQSINDSRDKGDMLTLKRMWRERGYRVGPIVRIEVPAPKEASK